METVLDCWSFPPNKALLYSYRLPFMSLNQGSESSSASDYDGGDKCIDNNGMQGGGECKEPSVAETKFPCWKDTAKRIRDVVIFPLISGLMIGLGTVVGRRLGEAWFYSKDDAYVSK